MSTRREQQRGKGHVLNIHIDGFLDTLCAMCSLQFCKKCLDKVSCVQSNVIVKTQSDSEKSEV